MGSFGRDNTGRLLPPDQGQHPLPFPEHAIEDRTPDKARGTRKLFSRFIQDHY